MLHFRSDYFFEVTNCLVLYCYLFSTRYRRGLLFQSPDDQHGVNVDGSHRLIRFSPYHVSNSKQNSGMNQLLWTILVIKVKMHRARSQWSRTIGSKNITYKHTKGT